MWVNGVIRDLGPGMAIGINDYGWTVGFGGTLSNYWPALWVGEKTFRLPASGSANAVNNQFQIVGDNYTSGWLWEHGNVTTLPFPAYAINNGGIIVGGNHATNGAYIWENGVTQHLQNLVVDNYGWRLIEANGINDLGQICGIAHDPQGRIRAYRLDPVGNAPSWMGWALGGEKKDHNKVQIAISQELSDVTLFKPFQWSTS